MLKEAKGIIASNYDCQRQGIHKIRIAKVEVSTVAIKDDMLILDTKERLRVSG